MILEEAKNILAAGGAHPLPGPKTCPATASLVSFYNGFMLDAHALVETVRKASPALVALDVTQSLRRAQE